MADVFISYHKTSAGALAKQIADALDAAGISCWYMGRDSKHGRYPGKITRAIRECSVFLLILNQGSNTSKNVSSEVNIAFKCDKEILPFHIDDCKISDELFYHISAFSTITANPPDEGRVKELVEEIADILQKEPPPAPAPPPKILKRGDCGDGVTYTLDENGVLTIAGRGPMRNFEWDSATKTVNTPWRDERKTLTEVEIQDGVTSIGAFAFEGCAGLTSVTIPDGVNTIGYCAFDGCAGLTSVTIPDGVTYIGRRAFDGCAGLTSVTIPDSVTYIGMWAFDGCAGLTSVTIPDSVSAIGYRTFDGCENLKRVSVPAGAYVYDDAFPDWVRVERRGA